MLLPIESWLATAEVGDEAKQAFAEAGVCYKAGAYRSALLATYLGWGLSLRGRILRAAVPTGVPPGLWQQIHTDLRDDEKWDAATFEATQRKKPAPVFLVSDDLRRQVLFWKDRRNDAAHFKDNEIGGPHVEGLWLFVRSNLPKFVPNGSAAALLARLGQHFDPNVTPPGQDLAPVVAVAPAAVPKRDVSKFLEDLADTFTTTFGTMRMVRRSELAQVHRALFGLSDPLFVKETVDHLRQHPERLVEVVREDPGLVQHWASDAALIRRLWRELLWSQSGARLPVLAALVRNGLIPATEQQEANEWFATHLAGELPTQMEVADLDSCGFFATVKKVAFIDGKVNLFDWGNPNAALVRWMLEREPMEDATIRVLCSVFCAQPYPNTARDAIKDLFATNAAKKAEFTQRAAALGETPPADLI